MNSSNSSMVVRNVKFDFSQIDEQHYFENNMFATHFMNSLHIVFPEGEKLFIRSVRYFQKEVTDPQLKEEIKTFVSQEGIHNREHERFWEQLESMDLKPMGFVKFFRTVGFDFVESVLFKLLPKRFAQKFSLSITVAAEHYTALFANQALGNRTFNEGQLPKEMGLMMLWHAAEELEHKAVAFNVFKEVSDSYLLRILGMIFTSFALYFFSFAGMIYFIYQDKNRSWNGAIRKMYEFLSNYVSKPKGAAGWKLLLDYFRPGFHPDDHDNYALAEDFFEEYELYFKEKAFAK